MAELKRGSDQGEAGEKVSTLTGLAAGMAGIIASSCCVLPIVLVGLGLGSVGAALLPTFAKLRPYALGLAALAIAVGWAVALHRGRARAVRSSCAVSRPLYRGRILLGVATLVVLLAFVWQPLIEPRLLVLLR